VRCIVVPRQLPGARLRRLELGERRIQGVQLERSRGGGSQEQPKHCVNDAAMTRHDDRLARMRPNGARYSGTHPEVELGRRLTSGKHHLMWVAVPVGHSETFDVLIERHPVDLGSGIMFAEPVVDLHRQVAETWREDLGCLDRSWKVAREEDVSRQLPARLQSCSQAVCLLTAEIRKTRAGSEPTNGAINGHIRLAVTDQDEPSRYIADRRIHEGEGTRHGRGAHPPTFKISFESADE
jgi:hypothetical protein